MNRTQSPVGGRASLFGGASAPSLTSSTLLHRRAGRRAGVDMRAKDRAFDQLEQRQMLFALYVPAQGVPTPNGAPASNTTFAWESPFLQKDIPTIMDTIKYNEDFDSGGNPLLLGPVLLPPRANNNAPVGNRRNPYSAALTNPYATRITHTGFGNLPAAFPTFQAIPGGADDTDEELNINLITGRSVSFQAVNQPNLKLQLARSFAFTVLQLNQPPPQMGMTAAPQESRFDETKVRVRLFRTIGLPQRTLIATFNPADLAGVRVDNNTTPRVTSTYQFSALPDFFDEVELTPVAGGDQFDVMSVNWELPPGSFTSYWDDRTRGGATTITGASNGTRNQDVQVTGARAAVARTVNEIFDTDTGALNRRLASGTIFDQRTQLNFTNYTAGNAPQIVTGPTGGADRALSFALVGNQTFSFQFRDATGNVRPMVNFTFSVPAGANGGQLDAGTQIQLFRRGQLVRTYQQADFDDPAVKTGNAQVAGQNVYVLDTATSTTNFQINPDTVPELINNAFAAFDEVRVSRVAGGTDAGGITIDRVSPFAPTMAEFFDLYGRPLRPTNTAKKGPNDTIAPVDLNDDGIPEYNDGIGRIDISNGSEATAFALNGGTIDFNDADQPIFVASTQNTGNMPDFGGQKGFGFALDATTMPRPIGTTNMPGLGSIIIGAPFFRPNDLDVNYHGFDTTVIGAVGGSSTLGFHGSGAPIFPFDLPLTDAGDFSNVLLQTPPGGPVLSQGVFTPAGTNTGSVTINGLVMGNSRIGGAVRRFNVATLLGSLTVDGDVGALVIANDAGAYFITPTPATPPNDARGINTTGTRIDILRNAQQILVGGRNFARITVFSDVNNPNLGRLSFASYSELERVPGFQSTTPVTTYEGAITNGAVTLFGGLGYRNDTILGSEYIGNSGSSTTVSGTLGNFNNIQGTEDSQDVYAFPAEAGREITFDAIFNANGQSGLNAEAYVVDSSGRVQNAHPVPQGDPNQLPGSTSAIRFTFTPNARDIYYLVVHIEILDGGATSTQNYTVRVNGMAATDVGMISSSTNFDNFIEVRSNLGLFRSGGGASPTGGYGSAGSGLDPGTGNVANEGGIATIEQDDDLLATQAPSLGALTTRGTLYSLTFGSDVEGGIFTIGGDLGSFRTGVFYQTPLSRAVAAHGDVTALTLNVGGTISSAVILGDLGNRRDAYLGGPVIPSASGTIDITTGNSGGLGSILEFYVSGILVGQSTTFTVRGSQSRFNQFTVVGGIFLGNPTFLFPDGGTPGNFNAPAVNPIVPNIPAQQLAIPLLYNTPIQLVSATGVNYVVEIVGGTAARGSGGFILTIPIDGTPGSALANITVNLFGGAELRISATTPGRLDIGAINITTFAPAVGLVRRSNVTLTGAGEIDVGVLTQTGVGGLDNVANQTRGGDIVAMDVASVNRVQVAGNLGQSQVTVDGVVYTTAGVGYILAARGNGSDVVGGTLGIDQQFFAPGTWNGTEASPQGPGRPARLIGGIDPTLNGLIVRTGNVTSVSAGGALGDLFLMGVGGTIQSAVANSDGVTGDLGFDGVIGTIVADNIVAIDLGQGLRGPGDSPLAKAGIFALGSIGSITATNRGGVRPVVNGVIVASGQAAPPRGLLTGINSISISNGLVDGARIFGGTLDSFWRAPLGTNTTTLTISDPPVALTPVRNVQLTNTPFFRSEIYATTINSVVVRGAAFDGSIVVATQTIGGVTADRFINSTRDGEPLEFRTNQISAGNSIGRISVNGAGDISDLRVTTFGNLTGISARNITRLSLDVRQVLGSVSASNDIRSSTFTIGRLDGISAGGDIRGSTFDVAGPVRSLSARGSITNTAVTSTGANGRIDAITAGGDFSGTITSSGPIASLSAGGSFSGVVTTTDASDGDLNLIRSTGNMPVSLHIAKNIGTISTGGSFGVRPSANGTRDFVDVSGTLGSLIATGQLYADLRVGQTINLISIGRVAALPANDLVGDPFIHAFGRINSVNVVGDFNGSILSDSGGIGSVSITNGSFRIGNDDDANGVIDSGERNSIEARDGDLGSVVIANGSLFGDIIARDGDIRSVSVTGSGAFGRIGIDRGLSTSAGVTGDLFRNQLPPGTPSTGGFGGTAAVEGPTIHAGRDVISVSSTGAAFEVSITAGRNVTSVSTGGFNTDALGAVANANTVAAGDTVGSVVSRGLARGLTVVGGLTDLGADGRAGGTGANADGALKSGRVTTVTSTGGSDTLAVSAGVNPGTDGLYNTLDGDSSETAAPGISTIGTVTITGANATAPTAFADTSIGTTSAAVVRNTSALPADARTFTGVTGAFTPITGAGLAITTTSGETGRIVFIGPGQAFWDAANNRVVLISSTLASTLRIDAATPTDTLTNLGIVSNDDAQLGSLSVNGRLRSNTGTDSATRNSRVFVDGTINSIVLGNAQITADVALPGSGIIASGQDIGSVRVGVAGTAANPAPANQFRLEGQNITSVTVLGDLGTTVVNTRVDALNLGTVSVTGDIRAIISSSRNIASVTATGALVGARVRAGGDLTSVSAAGSSNLTRISSGGNIGSVSLRGDAADTTITGGIDLGTDGTFGGAGTAADRITSGNVTSVSVTGGFLRSDVVAGVYRGTDGFLTTADDIVADGRSSIGSVRVGATVGSTVNSQRYGIVSNGTIGSTIVGGAVFTGTVSNFTKSSITRLPPPIQVNDLTVDQRAPRLYTARLAFNQAIDLSTIGASLSISEVRFAGQAEQLIPLVQGVDYTFRFDLATNSLFVDFVEAITARNLVGNTAGPLASAGVYRFVLDAATLRGGTTGSTLDGNRDGSAAGGTDDFSADAVVGDAGDRTVSGQTAFGQNQTVDLFGPISLDQLLTANRNSNFTPATNNTYRLRGILGDHADTNIGAFGAGGDVDVYTITLRAGQILRLGALTGSALNADVAILDGANNPVFSLFSGNVNPNALQAIANADPNVGGNSLLVRTSGTYTIAILPPLITPFGPITNLAQFNPGVATDIADPTTANGGPSAAGQTGDYAIDVTIADDGDSGFYGTIGATDAAIANANVPNFVDFTGVDGVLGTIDDIVFIIRPDDNGANPTYSFQVYSGTDGLFNTADDFIFGSNGNGVFVRRDAGGVTTTRTTLAGAAPVDPDGAGASLAVPVPNDFRGVDNTFNTADDLANVTRAGTDGSTFAYSLNAGADGVRGTADDLVIGSNGRGFSSSRTSGADGVFGNGDDVVRLRTDAGDGVSIDNALLTPSQFAGVDGVLGTADDIATIVLGSTTFRLDRGANRRFDGNGTAQVRSDDVITGVNAPAPNAAGLTSTRTSGVDGIFGTADDVFTTLASAAIGDPGNAGVSSTGALDVDVYHLNSGASIAPGTRIRATLKVTEIGGNLSILEPVVNVFGSNPVFSVIDNRGLVQFGLFDTSSTVGLTDADLVAAPRSVLAFAGQDPKTTSDGTTSYGIDANGDFFMEFLVPSRVTNSAQAGTFALYVQGAVRSDYQLEIVTRGTGTLPSAGQVQNVLLETRGGSITWLEHNPYLPTTIAPFDAAANGFTGVLGANVPAQQFLLDNLVANLNAVFAAAGVSVVFSSNPSDFEGQDFSTVFLTSGAPPVAFSNNGSFGVSQQVDIFNADHNDQAVIFVGEYTTSNTPTDTSGANAFINSLTAGVARRVGELVGLRTTTAAAAPALNANANPLASNSTGLNLRGTGAFRFVNGSSTLTGQGESLTDTQFLFGNLNAFQLLNRIFGNP